ncbi:hypothetical protein STEG23_035062, partial [Scotinomys teguina]
LKKGRFWITPDPYHKDDNIQIGREVKISCQVEAVPSEELTFSWFKNGRPLRSSERMVITQTDPDVSPGTTNLDIIDLKFTDFGTYTCVASLKGGGISDISIDVNISSSTVPPNLTVPQEKSPLVTREGDTIELQCQVTGKPKPIILWSRADKEVAMPDGTMQMESYDGTLRIVNVSREMSGMYRCQTSQYNGFNVKPREALVQLIVQWGAGGSGSICPWCMAGLFGAQGLSIYDSSSYLTEAQKEHFATNRYSPATSNTTPIKPATSNTTLIKPATSNTTPIKPATSNTTPIKPATSNTTPIKPATSNTTLIKPATSNTTPIKPATSNTTPIKPATSNTTPIKPATSNTTPIKPATSNTTPIKPATSNTTPIKPATSNTTPIKPATSNTAPIKPATSNTTPIKPATSNTTPIKPATSNTTLIKPPQILIDRSFKQIRKRIKEKRNPQLTDTLLLPPIPHSSNLRKH